MLRNSCFLYVRSLFAAMKSFLLRDLVWVAYIWWHAEFFSYWNTYKLLEVQLFAKLQEFMRQWVGKKPIISSFKNIFFCNFPNGPFSLNVSVICKLNFNHRFVWHFSFLLGYDGFITIHIYMVTCGISKKCLQNCKNSRDYEWEKFRIYFLKIIL